MTTFTPATYNLWKGDGSTTQFSFSFQYQDTSEVKVALYNSTTKAWVDQPTSAYSVNTATTVLFVTAPPASSADNIKVYRDTNITSMDAEFFPGSAIRAQDLNDNFEQLQFSIEENKDSVDFNLGNVSNLEGRVAQNEVDIAKNTADIATNTADIATNTADIATNAANTSDIADNTSDIADNTAAIANRWNKTTETTDQSETWVSNDNTVATTGAIEKRVLEILDDPTVPTKGYWNKNSDTINSTDTWSPSDNTVGTTAAIQGQLTPIQNNVATNTADIATNAANIASNDVDIANRWNKTDETLRSGWTSSGNLVATTEAIRKEFPTCTTSDTPPLNPEGGDLWLDSDTGTLYFWYIDEDSTQWISVSSGPQGPKGDPGTDGTDGTSATVDVGNTFTGLPGTNASVTNSGTLSAAVFNFTIPRGNTGATGAQGPQGDAAETITSPTPPASPIPGQLWFDADTGITYIYYRDENSDQWVSISNSYSPAVAGYGTTYPTAPQQGQLFYSTAISRLQIWSGSTWLNV